MFNQLLFISLVIILVMLAVMTCITYYFREKVRYAKERNLEFLKVCGKSIEFLNAASNARKEEQK